MSSNKLLIFLLTLTYVSSKNPCAHYKHGDFRYKLPDPYDCTKFWMCSSEISQQMSCPIGTSFKPTLLFGSCTGVSPNKIKDCYKYKNEYEALNRNLGILIRKINRLLDKLEVYDYEYYS